jgi:hypothetical protein
MPEKEDEVIPEDNVIYEDESSDSGQNDEMDYDPSDFQIGKSDPDQKEKYSLGVILWEQLRRISMLRTERSSRFIDGVTMLSTLLCHRTSREYDAASKRYNKTINILNEKYDPEFKRLDSQIYVLLKDENKQELVRFLQNKLFDLRIERSDKLLEALMKLQDDMNLFGIEKTGMQFSKVPFSRKKR